MRKHKREKVGKTMRLAREILKLLKEEPRQTPRSMMERMSLSKTTVMTVLKVLSDLGLVEARVRGLYEITPLGEYILEKSGEEGK